MKQTFITYRKIAYKLIALDDAGMGMLARHLMYGTTDAAILKVAREHPANIEIIRLY